VADSRRTSRSKLREKVLTMTLLWYKAKKKGFVAGREQLFRRKGAAKEEMPLGEK